MKMNTRTLIAVIGISSMLTAQAATYYLLGDANVNENANTSSMDGSGACFGWSTAEGGSKTATSVTAGNTYYITGNRGIRTPTTGYTLPQATLCFVNGKLIHKLGDGIPLVINDLVVAENGYLYYSLAYSDNVTHVLKGNVDVRAGGCFYITTGNSNTRHMRLESTVTGTGLICCDNANNAFPISLARFTGNMTGFTGRISSTNRIVQLETAVSFPGDCIAPTADGIALSAGELRMHANGTIGPNRGISLLGSAASKLCVSAGKRVTVSGALTGSQNILVNPTSGYTGELMLTHASPGFSGSITVSRGTLRLAGDAEALVSRCTASDSGAIVVGAVAASGAVTGFTGYHDDAAHSVTLAMSDPVSGYTEKWAWDGELDQFTHDAPQAITAVGVYTNAVRVQADGYEDLVATGVVSIAALPLLPLSIAGRTATVTVPAAAVSADSFVVLCWGESEGGDTISSWANSTVHPTMIGAAGGSVDFDLKALDIYGDVKLRAFITDNWIEFLDYIESSGTQWIDTGVVGAWGDVYEIKVSATSITANNAYVAGEYDASYNDRGRYQVALWRTDSKISQCVGGTGASGQDRVLMAGTVYLNTFYTFVSDFTKGNRRLEVYNADKTTLIGSDTVTQVVRQDLYNPGDYTIYLMAGNHSGEVAMIDRGTFKYCYFKLTRGGEVVKNLVAAKNGDKVGMYDTISGTFIENGGTGVFTYGSVTGVLQGGAVAATAATAYEGMTLPPTASLTGITEVKDVSAKVTANVSAFGGEAASADLYVEYGAGTLTVGPLEGEVEYLQGTGHGTTVGPYITTDFFFNPQTDRVEAEFAFATSRNENRAIWCARGKEPTTDTLTLFLIWTAFRFDYGSASGTPSAIATAANQLYTVTVDRNAFSSSPVTTPQTHTAVPSFTRTGGPLVLFASYYDGFTGDVPNHLANYSDMKLYAFRIYRNDELIHELVPVVRNGLATLVDIGPEPMQITLHGTAFTAGAPVNRHTIRTYEAPDFDAPQAEAVFFTNRIATAETVGDYEYTLTGLTPETGYSARLLAINNLGGTAVSAPTVFTTLAPLPTAVGAVVTDYEGYYDANQHGCGVEVTYPVGGEGCTFKWSYDEGGEYSHDAPALYREIGVYTNYVRITAEGLDTFYGTGVVTVAAIPATFYVTKGGIDGNPGTAEEPFLTVTKALTEAKAAIAGGEERARIVIGEGTYEESAQLTLNAAIMLEGSWNRDATVLSGANTRLVVSLSNAGAVVRNLTIANGKATGQDTGANIKMSAGTVEDCVIRNAVNDTNRRGLGAYMTGGRIRRCVFRNINYYGSSNLSSVIWMNDGTVENCLFTKTGVSQLNDGNRPPIIYTDGNSVRIVNCTFAGNSNVNYPFVINKSGARIINCVMYDANYIAHAWSSGGSNLGCFINCAGKTANATGTNCTTIEPTDFLDYASGDYRPVIGCRLVDAGSDSNYPSGCSDSDLDGNSRRSGTTIDIGCYEFNHSAFDALVSADAYGNLVGETVTLALAANGAAGEVSYTVDFGDGQQQVTTASQLTHTYAKPGCYMVTMTASDGVHQKTVKMGETIAIVRETVYVSTNGVDVAGDGTAAHPYRTIKYAASLSTNNVTGAASPAYTVLVAPGTYYETDVTLNGAVTVRGNGNRDEVILSGNSANRTLLLRHGDAVVSNLTIANARASGQDTGASINISAGTVEDCVIRNAVNDTNRRGLGAYMTGGRIRRCVFRNINYFGSTALSSVIWMSAGTVENCLFTKTSVTQLNDGNRPPIIYTDGNSVRIVNCTFAGNSNVNYPFVINKSGARIINCVMYDANYIAHAWSSGGSNLGCFINCAGKTANNSGTGCFVIDPGADFADYSGGDFYPAAGSALVDSGSESDYPDGASNTDLGGDNRRSGTIDIGCYEFSKNIFNVQIAADRHGTYVGTPVNFEMTPLAASGLVSYTLDYGDGTQAEVSTSTASHTYTRPGCYVVTVAATDGVSQKTVKLGETIAVTRETVYVAEDGDNVTGDGTAAHPYGSIKFAVNLATNNFSAFVVPAYTIRVGKGTYAEKGIQLRGPVTVIGEGDARTATASDGVYVNTKTSGTGSNPYEYIFSVEHASAVLENIRIHTTGVYNNCGRNLVIANGTVRRCNVTGGSEDQRNVYMTDGRLEDTWISGGGCVNTENPGLANNLYLAGGVATRLKISGGYGGNGVHLYNSAVLSDSLITGFNRHEDTTYNKGANYGHVVRAEGSSIVRNCSIIGNKSIAATRKATRSAVRTTGTSKIINCVIYDNTDAAGEDSAFLEWNDSSTQTNFINCAFGAGFAPASGTACIDTVTDATFKDYANKDYHHSVKNGGSILVDAGTTKADYLNLYGGSLEDTDLDGSSRIVRRLDIGCYESASSPVIIMLR